MLKNIKILVLLLSFFIILLVFLVLSSGIKFNSFQLFSFKISQFYLKLDKKLILNIDKLEYKSKKIAPKNSFDGIKEGVETLPKVLKMFQHIEIKELKLPDDSFYILINDDSLKIDNKLFYLDSKIDSSSKQVSLNILSLYLKDVNLFLNGVAKLDYFNKEIKYFGDVFYEDLILHTNIDYAEDKIKFFLRSEKFKNLHFLKKYLDDLPKVADEWMYDNVEGDFILHWLYGEFDLDKNEILEKSIQGEASILNAKIKYEPRLEAISTSKVAVNFKNDTLHFSLEDAKYKGKNLNNSFVTIKNLTNEDEGLVLVNIETISSLDKDIVNILKAYDIELPVIQKNGLTNAKLLLSFPYAEDKPIATKGEFIVDKSDINISGFEFKTNHAKVFLNDDLLTIKDAIFLYNNMINALVNLELDLNSLKANGDVNINQILIEDSKNNKILDLKNENSPISMDFSKNVDIFIKDLNTDIKYEDNLKIDIDDISKIAMYSDILKDNSIKKGSLNLSIEDENNIEFQAYIKELKDIPIKKYKSHNIEELEIYGDIKDGVVNISSKDNTIKAKIDDNTSIFLDSYIIDIDPTQASESENIPNMQINLKECALDIDDTIFNINSAKIDLKDGKIEFEALISDLDLPLKKDNKKIDTLDLSGEYENNILKIESKNKDLYLTIKNSDKYSINIDGYDIFYSLDKLNDSYSSFENLNIVAKNSNIIIDEKYKILSDYFELDLNKNRKFFYLEYEKGNLSFTENSENIIDIYIAKVNSKFINSLFNNKYVEGGEISFYANGTMNNLNGKIIIDDSKIENLSILNKILFVIESTPALINPLLAIPSVLKLGQLGSYKVDEGFVEFNYNQYKNILDIKRLLTNGNGMDFDGSGTIDINKQELDANIKLIFLKGYSSFFYHIPILNHILLGSERRVATNLTVNGSLSDPKITTNLLKDGFSAPLNLIKRVFTSPVNLYNNISNSNKKEE